MTALAFTLYLILFPPEPYVSPSLEAAAIELIQGSERVTDYRNNPNSGATLC